MWGGWHDCGSTWCYSPTSGTTHLMDLVNLSLFILPYQIISDFKPWGDSLRELTYLTPFTTSQTHVCLMANLVLLNLILFLTVHFHAVHGYAATHMHITHVLCFSSILPLSCSCIMWNTSKAASTLGYLKRLLGPLGKWREGIESALEGNSKRIRLGMPVNSLAFIYYHTVCTCVYQIYRYCLGQA